MNNDISRILLSTLVLVLPLAALGASGGYPLEHIDTDIDDLPSLQRGAQTFMNYCIGCHGLRYQRHNRTARDLGIPEDLYREHLLPGEAQFGSHMTTAMPEEASKSWFGAPPPDLTMVTRVRGADWVYSYLKTFYLDPKRLFGVNNEVLENAGMPHVLMELQGVPRKVCKQVPKRAANGGEMRDPLEPSKAVTEERCGIIEVQEGTGELSAEAYDQLVYDVTNFLAYVAEPYKDERQRLGVFVLLFLLVLFVLVYLLAREYQKEVH